VTPVHSICYASIASCSDNTTGERTTAEKPVTTHSTTMAIRD